MKNVHDPEELSLLFEAIITDRLHPKVLKWLSDKREAIRRNFSGLQFGVVFTAIPRTSGSAVITLTGEEKGKFSAARRNFVPDGWTAGRFCRVWWLLQLPSPEEKSYLETFEGLFKGAGMEEQVALYSSLPLLLYPEKLKLRAAEGIRTNMGPVFDAVALDNPYPSEYLDEPAWNQLVLKAFFMDKPVEHILGLDERANRQLAHILSDYAHERWSAGRRVSPKLWRLTGKFMDEKIIADMKRLFASGDPADEGAAALACSQSELPEAGELLRLYPALKEKIGKGELRWSLISQ